MARITPLRNAWLAGLLGLVAIDALAETPTSAPRVATASLAPSPNSSAIRPKVTSQATTANISAQLPSYAPPKPEPATPPPDLRDTDRPRNGIIRLPDYIVRGDSKDLPSARDVLTPKGKLEIALKRQPGLGVSPFNQRIALFMLNEEYRLQDMKFFNELIELIAVDAPDEARKLKAQWQRTYMRSDEWIDHPFTPAPNRLR